MKNHARFIKGVHDSLFVSILSLALLCGSTSVFAPAASAQTVSAVNSVVATGKALDSKEIEQKVSELLQKMTLEEKIGQLVQYSAGQATGPTSGRTDDTDMIRKGQVGSLFNATGARKTNELQRLAVEESRPAFDDFDIGFLQ